MSPQNSRRIVLGIGALSVAFVSAAGLASSALFTSQDSSSGNSFAAGTVVLNAGGGAKVFTVTNAQEAPGTESYGKVTIANQGSLGLRYAMTSTPSQTKGLADHLQLKVVATDAAAACDKNAITGGTAIYDGALSGAAFGSIAAGAQTGDRALAANASEALCMQVTFPNGTAVVDNAFQGGTAGAAFTFDAEQTLNN